MVEILRGEVPKTRELLDLEKEQGELKRVIF
jgi:hypothetical protein